MTLSFMCFLPVFVHFFHFTDSNLRCGRGQFLNIATCESCALGTFMAEDNHQFMSCQSCTPARIWLHEVIIEGCNITTDTKIACAKGYYRKRLGHPDEWECERCRNCAYSKTFQARSCTVHNDTVCCPQPGMTLEAQPSGSYVCVDAPVDLNMTAIQCYRGTYLSISGSNIPKCLPCERGTFMDRDLHSSMACRACRKPMEDKHEVEVASCTATADTVLGCSSGYYKHLDTSECLQCSRCPTDRPHEAQPCSNISDTVCCPAEDMQVIKLPEGGFKCVSKSVPAGRLLCPAGQYVEYNHHKGSACRPCENGTFMPVSNHTNLSCKPCTKAYPELKEVEFSKCTQTTDTIIVCQEGYFIEDRKQKETWNTLQARHFLRGCQRCSTCADNSVNKYEGRPCGKYTDTVCCDQPGMTVTNDANGRVSCTKPKFSQKVSNKLCGRGHFVQKLNRKSSCRPCPEGTFMDKAKHNSTSCHICTEANATNHEIVTKNCTTKIDTKIKCQDGFHFDKKEPDKRTCVKAHKDASNKLTSMQKKRKKTNGKKNHRIRQRKQKKRKDKKTLHTKLTNSDSELVQIVSHFKEIKH